MRLSVSSSSTNDPIGLPVSTLRFVADEMLVDLCDERSLEAERLWLPVKLTHSSQTATSRLDLLDDRPINKLKTEQFVSAGWAVRLFGWSSATARHLSTYLQITKRR